jgi:hypothetical protein
LFEILTRIGAAGKSAQTDSKALLGGVPRLGDFHQPLRTMLRECLVGIDAF